MAKFRYVGDEPRQISILPAGDLRRVEPDEIFGVGDKVFASYACQPDLYEVIEAPVDQPPADTDQPDEPTKSAPAKKAAKSATAGQTKDGET